MTDALFELSDFEETRPVTVMRLTSVKNATIRHIEKHDATHGCAECGLAPSPWNEAYGAYMDGMGRFTRCGYCGSCAGTGWTLLRDPWTDAPVSSWHEVPCRYCYGGWTSHAWNCKGHDDAYRTEPHTVTVYGTDSCGRVYFPGDVVSPDPQLCIGVAA